jgi:putative SOS response-associated peptidase YedK
MCGRYTLKVHRDALAAHLDLPEVPPFQERYNIAPSQDVPVLRADHKLVLLKWGLVPSWSKEPKAGFANINARAETVAQSNAYRSAFKHRRCLMPADGFFEWAPGPPKQPHYFHLRDGSPFAFAGLWERWDRGAEPIETCALITTTANGVVAPVHPRMPVILEKEDYGYWLDAKATPEDLLMLLKPLPRELMVGYPVSTLVNRAAVDDPRCIEPVGSDRHPHPGDADGGGATPREA